MADEAFTPASGSAVNAGLIATRIGEQVRAWRQEAGISEADLAACLRLSIDAVRHAEDGASSFTPEQIVAICKAFDVKPSRFLGDVL